MVQKFRNHRLDLSEVALTWQSNVAATTMWKQTCGSAPLNWLGFYYLVWFEFYDNGTLSGLMFFLQKYAVQVTAVVKPCGPKCRFWHENYVQVFSATQG